MSKRKFNELMIAIMKKTYNQPIVEVAHLINGVQALCSSPTPGNVDLGGGGGGSIDPD